MGRRLAVDIGLFFAWLLAYPMSGPLLHRLALPVGSESARPFTAFLLVHATALAVFGVLLGRRSAPSLSRRLAAAGVVGCAAVTLGLVVLPPAYWTGLLSVGGMFAAWYILDWGTRFATGVPAGDRLRVMALGIVIANVVYGLCVAVSLPLAPAAIGLFGGALLVVPLLGVAGANAAIPAGSLPTGPVRPHLRLLWRPALLILAFNVVGGVYYQVTIPYFAGAAALDRYYRVVPYIAALLWFGWGARRVPRRALAVTGIVMLGASYALLPMLPAAARYLISFSLIQVGIAAFDLYIWLTVASLASRLPAALTYGLGLALNVGGLFAGSVAATHLLPLVSDDVVIGATLLASAALFVATIGLVQPDEPADTAPASSVAAPVVSPPSLTLAPDVAARLTRREREVTELLLKGLSGAEIESALHISQGTLKSHMSHIYRKLGVSSRQMLVLAAIGHGQSPSADST